MMKRWLAFLLILTLIAALFCSCSSGEEEDFSARQIDHLMAKPNPHMAVDYWSVNWKGYEALEDRVKFGYISDHYGIIVKVRINTNADYSQYQVEH